MHHNFPVSFFFFFDKWSPLFHNLISMSVCCYTHCGNQKVPCSVSESHQHCRAMCLCVLAAQRMDGCSSELKAGLADMMPPLSLYLLIDSFVCIRSNTLVRH